jgi:adenosine deaminase
MTPDIHTTLLSAKPILDRFLAGESFDLAVFRTLVFVECRSRETSLPDYVFKNYQEREFDGDSEQERNSHSSLLLTSFNSLDGHFIQFRRDEVFINKEQFGTWQEMLTFMTPLPLVSYAIYKNMGFAVLNDDVWREMKRRVDGHIRQSALPVAYFPQLEEMIEKEGLVELHMHLNGTTEMDGIWQDALQQPRKFYTEVLKGVKKQEVQEQYRQLNINSPVELYSHILLAKKLRYVMLRTIFPNRYYVSDTSSICAASWELPMTPANARKMIANIFQADERHPTTLNGECHPIEEVRPGLSSLSDMGKESVFFICAFNYLERTHDEAFALCMHTYLLILALFNRVVVHQKDQKGFDQFQKITVNDHRRHSERTYLNRFKQLEGMYREYLHYLEGRFPPWKAQITFDMLNQIIGDYERYWWDCRRERIVEEKKDQAALREQEKCLAHNLYPGRKDAKQPQYLKREMQLKLIAHFIKEKDQSKIDPGQKGYWCRHLKLRRGNAREARTLLALCRINKKFETFVNGADAAANELHTPPEVYAPIFRMLRRQGWSNFTFHVGEDFVHLVSGIRAIYEALIFLDLRDKNRVGHATAIGISPALWLDRMRPKIAITQGEWLDNLAFAYYLIGMDGVLVNQHSRIREHIGRLFYKIYGEQMLDIHTYVESWRMRSLDPLKALGFNKRLETLDRREWVEWGESERAKRGTQEFKFTEATSNERKEWQDEITIEEESKPFNLFRRYHSHDVMKRYTEMIEVDADFFPREVLVYLQKKVLVEVKSRCVAIETMPTSNVRISFYNDCREHHLFRWLGLACEKNHTPADEELDRDTRPDICIASDDPGIFATNLRNEYAHVYNTLITDYGKCHVEAIDILKRINENCRVYRFEEKPSLIESG